MGAPLTMLSMNGIRAQAAVALHRPIDYDEVLELAAARDPAAAGIVKRSGLALGRLVAAVANLTMSQRIFVSGEGVHLAEIAWQAVFEGLERDRDPAASAVDLVIQAYDSDLWVRGAASVAIQQFILGGAPT